MKLHRLVRGSINVVNCNKLIPWLASQGPIIDETGIATPTYAPVKNIWVQVQPLPTDELMQLEQLNIQGVLRQVYMRDAVASAVRADGTGGDLLQFPERWTMPPQPLRTWLVVLVSEQWNSWCHAIVRMQNDMNYVWTADSSVTADTSQDADA